MLTQSLSQVFEQLKKPTDPKVIEQRERELNERAQSQYDRAQRRQAEIVRLHHRNQHPKTPS